MKIYRNLQIRAIVPVICCGLFIIYLNGCSGHKTVQKETKPELTKKVAERLPAQNPAAAEKMQQVVGSYGKITGRIIDSETGEPLPGVHILVRGTKLGAATDIDGVFVILNVPAGEHELEANYIGFASRRRNITVVTDQKINVDFEITVNALAAEKVMIEAEKEKSDSPIIVIKKPVEPTPGHRSPSSVEPNLLDQILDQMPEGSIAFNTPPAMNIKETATVELVLDLTKSITELQESITAAGEKDGARIKVAADAEMEAKLVSSHFEITPVTPEIQPISKRYSTNWK